MKLRDILRLGTAPRPDYLASPLSDAQLTTVALSDIFQGVEFPTSRADAMRVPAISKARSLICTTVARLPLRVLDKDGLLSDEQQPAWTYRTDGIISPFLRMIWTLDDLLIYGDSLWYVVRGSGNAILSAERVPYSQWKIDNTGAILINEEPVDADYVFYFQAPIEGLLDRASEAIRAARSIDQTVANRVRNPIPVMEIHATDVDTQPTQAEATEMRNTYNAARRDPDGATVYTPAGIELKSHGDKTDFGFMETGRNAVRLDMANFTGVPAALLDGSVSEASLTYSTSEGKRNEFIDYSLAGWIGAIESRLSQDDVVPRGQRVRFDLSDFLALAPSPTGTPEQD